MHTCDIVVYARLQVVRTLKSPKREVEHIHPSPYTCSRRPRRTDMSDREGHVGSGSTDDDLSLPKATVAKMISGECCSLTSLMLGRGIQAVRSRIAPKRSDMCKRNPGSGDRVLCR